MPAARDFSPLHAAMRRTVHDDDLLAGVSSAVIVGNELVDVHCEGMADREAGIALREDHVFRAFSNTKLVVTVAALLLMEEGRLALDEPIGTWLPALANLPVLKPGATRLEDTVPAERPVTLRHLMSHSGGFSYPLQQPANPACQAYAFKRVLDPTTPLATMLETLSTLPLLFQPGTAWEYGVSSDVLGRVIEVVSGQPLDAFLQSRVFGPLEMVDTGFHVRPDQRDRFTGHYLGDLQDPMKPGLRRHDDFPWPGAFLRPMPRLSGGGGLVSTLPDMVALIRRLIPVEAGGVGGLLKPETVRLMMTNQLADGISIRFATTGPVPGKVFGLGGAITRTPGPLDPADSEDEFQWGGISGTHWWIQPRTGVAGITMSQRHLGFWHPSSFEFKRAVYAATR